MTDLATRIKTFLNRRPPPEVNYIPGSVVEGLMATYAAKGSLDPRGEMLLDIYEAELADTVAAKAGPAADYFRECLEIVRAIQKKLR